MKKFKQVKAVLAGLVLSSSVMPAAMADDIEIYVGGNSQTAAVNPNILFLVDVSGSMSRESSVRDYYDKRASYSGNCQRDGIYFVPLGEDRPDCSTSENYFNRSALECDYALNAYDANDNIQSPQVDIGLNLFGTYSDQFARMDDSIRNSPRWEKLPDTITSDSHRDYTVECLSDSGHHGTGSADKYITDDERDGYTSTAPVNLTVPHPVWAGGEGHMTLYDGNYLNYLTDTSVGYSDISRLDQITRAVEIMVSTNNRINISLMVFDQGEYEGGSVQYPMEDVVSARNNFTAALNNLRAQAGTPLSESYYEALLYYGGKTIDYGDDANPAMNPQAKDLGSGRDSSTYASPISSVCGVNYIVLLSDGEPTADNPNTAFNASTDRFDLLPGMSKNICNTEHTYGSDNWRYWYDDNQDVDDPASTVDNCLDDLAEWANTNDVAQDNSLPEHSGDQHIITHTIGFALDTGADTDALKLLEYTAEKGAGKFYTADSGDQLVYIFEDIVTTALKVNTTFSSPAVSVNAFNRSTHLDDLYFTLFKPHATNNAWQGNLKKYKLNYATNLSTGEAEPFIADKYNAPAVDAATGYFSETATSFWSIEVDGKFVQKGGAASKLGASYDGRKVYTITGAMTDGNTDGVFETAVGDLTAGANEVDLSNAALTDALLGITGKASILDDANSNEIPYRTTMINWAAGEDVFGDYGVVNTTTDARLNMGDPLHAEPALVQYGAKLVGGVPEPDMVAYVATNEGYLHAFDVTTGVEIFSFIPQELLTKLPGVMENEGGDKVYGLDGSVVAWINDADGNGTISGADEHVYLYFGMRRGGRNIYALNVTDRHSPELMWVIKGGTGDYTELGETWSTINVEKIKDGTNERNVLIFGGGYDATQDNNSARRVDTVGRAVYIADATSGARLWSGGADRVSPITDMLYSIPARIKPLDISGDGYIDRLYAADMGGQIFRFDINNTNNAALASSITGGRIADFAGASAEDARRFYYPPDVALIDAEDGKFHAVVISSGYRAHPLNEEIHDRIYMIKDRNTALITRNEDYKYDPGSPDAVGSLAERHLEDVTTNLAGGEGVSGADESVKGEELARIASAEGWYIDLDDEDNPGAWIGEKGLSEPLILEGVAIVSTFTPTASVANSCSPNAGTGKVFFLNLLDATPAYAISLDVRSERHQLLTRAGIPPSPNVIITKGGEPTLCVGTECQSAKLGLGIRKTYWYEVEE
jgi:type IV pilus assembly protein PilY1